ncbi:MAG: hypothetical protein JO349_06525 [Candidatus Eremiobacteraeota bacterium]|nr:hypothetical protein [Candidatus Eremiobacteraeota bacterium]
MIRRIEGERPSQVSRKLALRRTGTELVPLVDNVSPLLALRYSNGFVTVEVSYDALDRFIDLTGDIPLPVTMDPETGDRKAFDWTRGVKVIYDRKMQLREVTSQSRDGLTIRVNFPAGTGQGIAA